MLKERVELRDEAGERGCLGAQTENERRHDRAQADEDDDLERVEDGGATHVHALRRVVHLVEGAPEEPEAVRGAVVDVRRERDGGVADDGAEPHSERAQVNEAVSGEPFARQEEWGEGRDDRHADEKEEPLEPPEAALRVRPGGHRWLR